MKKTSKLTLSGIIIAFYVVIMYFTQSFAFGAWQIRIATSLYALSFLYPFLIVPLGLANFLSNMLMGGMGIADILGGTFVGIVTSYGVFRIRKSGLNPLFIIPVIIAGPGLIVPVWLSGITAIPYPALAVNLCIGQIIPACTGWLLVRALRKHPSVIVPLKTAEKGVSKYE